MDARSPGGDDISGDGQVSVSGPVNGGGAHPALRRLSVQLVLGVTLTTAVVLGVMGGLQYYQQACEIEADENQAVLHEGGQRGVVRLGITRSRSDRALRELWVDILLQLLVLEVVLTVPLILLLRHRFLRPVQALREFAERSVRGDPDQPGQRDIAFRSAELAELSRAVIHMRDSIREKVAALRAEVEDHKQTGAALRDSEESLRTTLHSIGDGVIATDIEGRIVRMNPVAERLTGWPCAEATGRKLSEVFRIVDEQYRKPVADPVERVLAAGGGGGVSNAGHPILLSRDGREHQVANSGAPIRAATGETLGVVLVFRDVTEEYAAQEQLRQSQKLDAIGRLAGGIAHDFNNMLSGILGGAELLQADLSPGDANRKHLMMIIESAERAAELSKKLLAFARQQDFLLVPTDVHRAVRDAVALLESTIDKRIKIDVRLATEPCIVLGDATQLQSVFLNLGINAWHAMPEGGALSLATAVVDLSETDCRGSAGDLEPGRYVEVRVRDAGRGIAPEHLPHIFDPFFTTQAHGKRAGLGLAAVYGTVRQHKGAILVRSEVGRGTYFRILLPLTQEAVPQPSADAAPVSGKGRVLVVDDEVVIREIVTALLSRSGYEVLVAEDGRVALEIYRKRFAEIDLVILDIVMPTMGGRECFLELKRVCPEVRVLFASGEAQAEDLNDLRAQGLIGLVRKPFRGAEFSRAVADALRAGSGEALTVPGGERQSPEASA